VAKLERNTELRGERYIGNPCDHSLVKLARETLYKKNPERELFIYRTKKQKKKKSKRKCNMALPMNWNEVGRHPGCCRPKHRPKHDYIMFQRVSSFHMLFCRTTKEIMFKWTVDRLYHQPHNPSIRSSTILRVSMYINIHLMEGILISSIFQSRCDGGGRALKIKVDNF